MFETLAATSHSRSRLLVRAIVAGSLLIAIASAQAASAHPKWPGSGELFVGTCYQPFDRSPEEIDRDIAIMRRAGFNVVRMGDLSWDSFEPARGRFEFAWFDKVLQERDLPGRQIRRQASVDVAGIRIVGPISGAENTEPVVSGMQG